MIPQKAIDLILEFEGLDQPGKWPGASSGITLGHGFDLGYNSRTQLEDAWGPHLTREQITRLAESCGVKGERAKAMSSRFKDIKIEAADAREVFGRVTIPRFAAETRKAFPGVDTLPTLAFGALVSLVFNRGASMDGPRRRHMKAIRDVIASKDTTGEKLEQIADWIQAMIPLWAGTDIEAGMRRRRNAEAALVREAIGQA